ncbi:MAG: restriction endonuclease subunit S, partial [Bacteroidia bacterium]|nr:restriction endonuclease subunit S [Bacteroidia bacterium]
ICKDGALTGKVAYVPHPMPFEKAMINEHVFRLVSNEQKILQKYLFCFLFSNSGQVILKANITGQAQGGLNSTNLLNISIPLPPEDIQESIVKEIEQIEEKEKSCLLQIENINQTIKFEYDNVVNSTDKYEKLENIAKDLFAGGDAPKDNFSLTKTDTFNVPVYSNGIKDKGLYGYTDIPKVTEPCITISARGTLGYTEVRTEPFVPIVRLIVLVPNELVDIKYLKIAASSLNFINSGSVIPQLTVPKVKNLEIPLPSIDEQKKLIAITICSISFTILSCMSSGGRGIDIFKRFVKLSAHRSHTY